MMSQWIDKIKAMKNLKAESRHKRGPWGFGQGREGLCEPCRPRGQWKQNVKKFLKDNLGMEIPDWKKKGSDSDEGQKACWKNKRAQLISQSEDIIEAAPGETSLPMVTFKNATHWPWKQGCTLSFHDKMSEVQNMVVEPINVPIDYQVKGQTEYSMAVPIKVFENAAPSDELHHVELAFRGPNGN